MNSSASLVRSEVAVVLGARLRSALLMSAAATFAVVLLDAVVANAVGPQSKLVLLAHCAALFGLWRVAHTTNWPRLITVALCTVGLYCILLTAGKSLSSEAGTTFMLVALGMATAAYLPWGTGPQAAAAAIILATILVHAFSSVTFTVSVVVLLIQISLVLAVSVFIARELYRQTLARVGEGLIRLDRERALREEATLSSALARVGAEMLAVADSPDLLDRVCRLACETLQTDAAHVFLLDSKEGEFACIASHGDTREQQEILRVLRIPATAIVPLLTRLKEGPEIIVHIDHRAAEPLVPQEFNASFHVQSSLALGLWRRGELLGVLTAGRRNVSTAFTPLEERIACGFAQFAALGLQTMALMTSLRQANSLKSEFVATMSHELRTPLHILMGYNDLMLEGEFGPVTSEQLRILRLMDKSAHDLLELINTTLDLSRLEHGRVRMDISTFTVRELFEEITADLGPAINENAKIRFIAEAQGDVARLTTDRSKLKVILKNLVSNAYKFTERGVIEIRPRNRDKGVEFQVLDTGCGIAPDVQPMIFDAFQQGESSLTRSRGGVGLGLYIVRRLANLLGGTASLVSTSSGGSVFSVWVPLKCPQTDSDGSDEPRYQTDDLFPRVV